MQELITSYPEAKATLNTNPLPIASIVKALCQAANAGPDLLYEVMLKLSLLIEATAPMYGLSMWSVEDGQRPRLNWAEGLDESELAMGQTTVGEALTTTASWPDIKEGHFSVCLVLNSCKPGRPGAALYGLCVRALTAEQARDLGVIVDVTRLAHSHVSATQPIQSPEVVGARLGKTFLPGMIFASRSMNEVARTVDRVKDSSSTVLITGESGTGKELVAHAIHRLSRRSEKDFIPFNCSAAPPDLIESMLFGHRKGSFTGALLDNDGLIRAAENGTLFLDEIGDLPLTLQPKLLRFLQEGEIHPLGDRAPRKVNVRVIAATHKDLEQLVRERLFREDLYYRIATLTVRIPPLRERPEDISALISHYLSHYARRNDRMIAGITWEAIHALESYSWPGNVRELAGEMERLVLYADENSHIMPEHISRHICPVRSEHLDSEKRSGENLELLMEDYERRVITETLKRNDCNVARTSEALGLGSRQTLYKKIKRLAIDITDFLQEDTEPGLQFRSERN
ncbi:MAG TPA: sigma-54 dependent transcriptional regulator [Pyrinomonadaceae bacterium]|jgi:transcriptional regulator with GAF, ATPase, and Fis domain|nr:sigma-54 dependent transcriptional regulator [Pyrinomonadaceae bacterium]